MREISGNLVAKGVKIAAVAARFNGFLVDQLVKGAADAYSRLGADAKDLDVVRVPGSNELPVAANRLAKSGRYDAIVCLGAVVRGATPHADLINETVARALSQIALETGVPVINGVVAADNLEQAVERCGTKQGNKGFSAVEAAVETVNVLREIG